MNDHGAPVREQPPPPAPPPLWRRLCQKALLGATGALGATAVTWLRAWWEDHSG
ncbi:hypothetical protein [Streptomyces sp. SID8352]|uniref:hypothetical protein n=1 Tax=unclassified Streptomyces TaxID=2593676 RepID=UPI001369C263|nr:hypothetical protein [Streptomyces sp. SID8352]MYU22348.1 hypothetical protein [Streptomyces sp. SID8352]